MSTRVAVCLAWTLWALCVALVAATGLLSLITPPILTDGPPALWGAVFVTLSLAYPTIGAIVASRRPKNPLGWVLCAVGLGLGLQTFCAGYSDYAILTQSGPLSVAQFMGWLASWVALPVVAIATVLLLLLFPEGKLPSGMLLPEGRLPSRSWHIVVWMAACGSALVALWFATEPGLSKPLGPSLWLHVSVHNPLAAYGAVGEVLDFLMRLGWFLLSISVLFAGVSLVSRRVLARGAERQQLKWFTYAAALMLFGFPATLIASLPVDFLIILLTNRPYLDLPLWDMGVAVGVFGFLFFPIAVGIGILRHRLYDIDVIINRTLVYGALTLILVLVYVGAIVLLQGVLRVLTGQGSQLAIVASTLTVAALFDPLRKRVQASVDRRFYRRKYDAARTLAVFNSRLRDEADLDALCHDMVGVAKETVQPEHASLWLRPAVPARKAARMD